MDKNEKLNSSLEKVISYCDYVKQELNKGVDHGELLSEIEQAKVRSVQVMKHLLGDYHKDTEYVRGCFYGKVNAQMMDIAIGVLKGTKFNLTDGLYEELEKDIRLDIQSEFLDSARELINSKDKDPAAVLLSIVMEDKIKQMAIAHDIENASGKEFRKLVNTLGSKEIILRGTQNVLLGFAELRNDALHANWDEIQLAEVNGLYSFLTVFLAS